MSEKQHKSFDPWFVGMKDAAEFLGCTPRTIKNQEGVIFPVAARDKNGHRYFRLDDLYVMYLKYRKRNPPKDFIHMYLTERGFDSERIATWVQMMVVAREKAGIYELEA